MQTTHVDTAATGHGTLKGYATGFVLSVILTAVPFALVIGGELPRGDIFFAIIVAAVVQIAVHLHYFLHLDTSSEERWNVMALLFTVLIIAIFIGGTIWIMYNLHTRMMDAGTTSPTASVSHFSGTPGLTKR